MGSLREASPTGVESNVTQKTLSFPTPVPFTPKVDPLIQSPGRTRLFER